MEFNELANLVFGQLKNKLENSDGLVVFAKERSKFEGWVKVELCGILLPYCQKIYPEKERFDLCFDDWQLEIKTLNTNIRYSGIENKHRPITKNTQGVINDIDKLLTSNALNKAVIFIVFPIDHDNKYWQVQFNRISEKLTDIRMCPFEFKGSTAKGVIYIGLV